MQKSFFFIIVFVSIIISACKKDIPKEQVLNPKAEFEKLNYYPFEISEISIQNSNKDFTYYGSINDSINIEFIKLDSVLLFIIPDLKEGRHRLDLEINNNKTTLAFEVKEISHRSNKVSDINRKSKQTSFTSNNLIPQNRIKDYEKSIESANEYFTSNLVEYDELKAEDKLIADKLISGNQEWMQEVEQAITDFKTSVNILRMKGNPLENHEENVNEAMLNYLEAKAKVIRHIPKIVALTMIGGGIGGLIGPAGISVGAIVGAGYAIGNLMLDVQELPITIDNLLTVALLPFQNMTSNKTSIQFQNNVYKDLTVTMDYRSIYSGDNNTNIPIAMTFLNGLNELQYWWNLLKTYIKRIKLFDLPNISAISSYTTETIHVHSSHLNIGGISNSNITSYNIDKTDGYFKVKFGSSQPGMHNFTFNVNYLNSDFGNRSNTVSAVLNAGLADSTAFYEAAVVGNWNVLNLEQVNPVQKQLEIYPGGTGKHTGSGGVPYSNGGYNITWWIVKQNNKYYLYETGFFHPGYNQFRIIGNNLPNENLSNPITLFKTYNNYGNGPQETLIYTKQ